MLVFKDDKFYCPNCEASLTIVSQNGGQGLKAKCNFCKVTYFYPACKKCGQATWNHDEQKCMSVQAAVAGKRYCRTCKTVKERSDFNMNGKTMSARCRPCQAAYFQEWYRSNRTASSSESVSSKHDDIIEELFKDM